MTITVARQVELLEACLRYCKAHTLVPAEGANPLRGVNTEADRDLIRQVEGHERGYHGDRQMPVDGTFNAYLQRFLDEHYGSAPPELADAAFVRPLRYHRGEPVCPQTSEFAIVDAEGACCLSGRKVHAGLDYFGGAGADVVAPEAGSIVEVEPSKGSSGQVFGGVVRVQVAAARLGMPEGHVWVFRHVEPLVSTGARVGVGDRIARIVRWTDWPAGSHAHIELWKSWRYGTEGYRVDNMLDPRVYLARAAVLEAWR